MAIELAKQRQPTETECSNNHTSNQIDNNQGDPADHNRNNGWHPIQIEGFFYGDEPGDDGQDPADEHFT